MPVPKGRMISLTAADGHVLTAYEAKPKGTPRGGIIIGCELFGVNVHIKDVCDGYAADGYHVVAPNFYDRVQEGGFAVLYSPEELEASRKVPVKLDLDLMALDVGAVLNYLSADGKVAMIGYCSGGSTAWYAASHVPGLALIVSYYGGRIPSLLDHKPLCPVLLNWGETDHTIPLDAVAKVEAAYPEIASVVYPVAGHGFNCDMRAAWHAEGAKAARAKTLEFLARYVG